MKHIERLGAYDGRMAVEELNKLYHRRDGEEIIGYKQPEEYGPVYFRTKKGYYKNLTEISEEEYNKII